MRVVEQTVEDGVAEGGIANDIVPVLDGDLAGEERAAAGVAVVEDIEEVVSSLAESEASPQSSRTRSHVRARRWMTLGYDPSPRARVSSSSRRETR